MDWGGTDKALIFIPGGCDTAFVFGDVATRLAHHFRVLGLTARGCGASDRPTSGFDMAHQLGDILGFIDALGLRKCVLIGHSSGGGKITQFAHHYPQRVDRLVYLDTVYGYVAPGLDDLMNAQIELAVGGHAMDSVENWKRAEKMWELGARTAALDKNFEETYSVGGWDEWAHLFRHRAAKNLREVAWSITLQGQFLEQRPNIPVNHQP